MNSRCVLSLQLSLPLRLHSLALSLPVSLLIHVEPVSAADRTGDGLILWNGTAYGADQEAFVTLTNVDATGGDQDLLLKAQSSSGSEAGVIEVWYQAVNQRIQVVTYAPGQDWVQRGADIPVIFVSGDQFGARARADGTVEVYRNGVLLATRDVTAWPYYADGGYIGLWFINAGNAVLDDFGGGDVVAQISQLPTAIQGGHTSAATAGRFPVTWSDPTLLLAALPDSMGLQQTPSEPQTTVIHYTYDPLSRLTQADSTGALTTTFAYAYDAVGNRTTQTKTITSTQVMVYQYDAANRLTSVNGQAYTWDHNGNLLNDGSATYLYDRANRMISTTSGGTTSLFNYNGDGARLQQIVSDVVTTYTQDLAAPLPVVLQSTTGITSTKYLYNVGTHPLAQNGGAWEYLLPDALGSVRQIADTNGSVTLAKSYEPYGNVLSGSGSASSMFAYTGEQADPYIKLVFLRARYYSPEIARFMSKDVWQGDYTRPQSLNAWAYVEGEPVNHTDPSGQWALDLSNQKVYLVAEEGDSWDSYLAGFYGKEVTVATLNSWLHLDLRLSPPRTGTKINITSALDPLIAKVAELGGGMEQRYYPPNVRPFNCYPTALTCAADECQYREYMGYNIDDFLRDNSRNVEYEDDLRYGDIFRIGGQDGGKREDGSPAFYNAPIHYGMILWRSGTTGKIWTFNGQITSYAFIAQLPDVLAYYRTEYPERDIRGVPKPEDFRGDFGPMHPTGFYRLNLSVSAAQIVQWIDDPNKTPSSK